MPTNENKPGDYAPPSGDIVGYPNPSKDSTSAGYEMTDVNAGGIVVFLGGLFGFVIIFFFFCYFMGKAINSQLDESYGQTDKWHTQNNIFAGAKANNGRREDLKSNSAMQQQEFQQMTNAFPNPRLETDDGNQDISDLHAREDLLLDHYSSVKGEPLRIPIDRAMQLIAAKGLPVSQGTQTGTMLAQDSQPMIAAPLTSGFARTGYELDQMEAREQKMEFERPKATEHAELKSAR